MADGFDRLKGAVADLVRQFTGHTDYHALYPAEVRAQNEDKTLELRPDSAKLPGFSRVAIRHGLPGVTVTVKQGARVLLGFEGGNPEKPYAALWTADSLDTLTVEAETKILLKAPSVIAAQTEGNSRRVARMGDLVKMTFVNGPPGTPNEAVGYIIDGAQKLTAE
jgi:hypothetical protein